MNGVELVTAGEAMAVAMPEPGRRLRHTTSLTLGAGGAELNAAIAAARLGISTGWISRLGADELGHLVLSRARAEGVDVSLVSIDADASTGFYLRERLGVHVRAHYMRRGSAASLLQPTDITPDCLDGARILHVSGILPALSAGSLDFARELVSRAHESGVVVSFDVNYREKLWPAEAALRFCEEILPLVDILFLSDEEADQLWGRSDAGLAKELRDGGPDEVVLKRGRDGAVLLDSQGALEAPAFDVPVLDTVGAGDAFAGGYLAARLRGLDREERLRTASALGAWAVMTVGDYEGLPDRDELDHFLDHRSGDQR